MKIFGNIKKFFNSSLPGGLVEVPVYDPLLGNVMRFVDPETAMAVSTVYSCVRVLSDNVASLPCKLYTRSGEYTAVADSNPLYNLLLLSPCPSMSSFDFWRFNIESLLLRRFSLSLIIRSGSKIVRLDPIHPNRLMEIKLDSAKNLQFKIQVNDSGEVKDFGANDVFYVPYGIGRDAAHPYGPLDFAGRPIRMADISEGFQYDALKNGGKPNGYWSSKDRLSQEDFERLSKQLKEKTSGGNRGGTPLVENSVEFKQITLTAADLQMVEQRRYTKEDICGIFGVPPHKIGDTKQAKGWSTMEQAQTEFINDSLLPLLVRYERQISRYLVPVAEQGKTYAKFVLSGILRGDMNTRANYYTKMHMIGVFSTNEIRKFEEMNPVDGGDEHFRPANLTPLDQPEQDNNDNEKQETA